MKIYCSLKCCPSADKMFYINDHKTTCHFLCLYSFWALRIHSRDLELCLLKWQSYTIQVSSDRCMKERKSPGSCWQHRCQSRWLRCECSYWSRGAGNVHQMNSCPPGSAAHSACWNSSHIKLWEKRAQFQLEKTGRYFSHCNDKKVFEYLCRIYAHLYEWGIYIDYLLYIKIGKYPKYSIMLVIPPQASITQFIFQWIFTVKQMLFSFSILSSNFHPVKQFCNGWINEIV